MIPTRKTAPATPVVSLSDLKAHLRVDGNDEDALITSYEAAAVAYLDGWRGILGRCIASQKWDVTYEQAGTYRLPFPDVTAVTASTGTANLSTCDDGWYVEISEPCTVTMTCALPADALDTVKMAIKLLVGHWFQNRETVAEGSFGPVPLAFDALIAPLRWGPL